MRTAIDLRAARGDASEPSPQFVRDLQERLQRGVEQRPSDQPSEPVLAARRRVSRRGLLEAGGVAAAVGVAVAIDRTVFGSGLPSGSPAAQQQLAPNTGTWQAVAPRTALAQGGVTLRALPRAGGLHRHHRRRPPRDRHRVRPAQQLTPDWGLAGTGRPRHRGRPPHRPKHRAPRPHRRVRARPDPQRRAPARRRPYRTCRPASDQPGATGRAGRNRRL